MALRLFSDLELVYALRDSVNSPQGLLILLHGVGGNEWSLEALADRMPPGVLVVLARHPQELSPGAFGSFRVAFTTTGPVIDAEAAEESRQKWVRFTEQLQDRFAVPVGKTLVAGFSQGGIMAASLALTRPDLVAGFAILSGRILPEIGPKIAPVDQLGSLQALVLHGREDTTLPAFWAERSTQWLSDLGINCQTRFYPARHEITGEMALDFSAWVQTRLTEGRGTT